MAQCAARFSADSRSFRWRRESANDAVQRTRRAARLHARQLLYRFGKQVGRNVPE